MSAIAWQTEYSVETAASPAFTWLYLTDINNWDDPPAQFKLDGPFATGSSGVTEVPGQEPRHWRLRQVKPGQSYTVEFPLEGAIMSCTWLFSELPGGRTRLTQRIILEGDNASVYRDAVQQGFAPALAPGMNKIAAAISQAYTPDP